MPESERVGIFADHFLAIKKNVVSSWADHALFQVRHRESFYVNFKPDAFPHIFQFFGYFRQFRGLGRG